MPPLLLSLGAATLGAVGVGAYATLHRNCPIFGAVLAQLPPNEGMQDAVALTFDDGPNPEATPRLLDILAEQRVVASFFLLGRHVVRWPSLARRIADEGHCVANHGFAHQRLDFAGRSRAHADIAAGTQAIEDATGVHPRHFRAPHGARSPFVTPAARALGQRTVGWSVGSNDHSSRDPDAIARRVLQRARPRSIVLLHDADAYQATGDRLATVESVRAIIPALRSRGLRLVALPR